MKTNGLIQFYKKDILDINITIKNKKIEKVNNFMYLGSIFADGLPEILGAEQNKQKVFIENKKYMYNYQKKTNQNVRVECGFVWGCQTLVINKRKQK